MFIKLKFFPHKNWSLSISRTSLFFFLRKTCGRCLWNPRLHEKTVVSLYKCSDRVYACSLRTIPKPRRCMHCYSDETSITHRHGNIGRPTRSHTVWVVVAVDKNSRRCSLQFKPSRSRADLYSFIQWWILPGRTIHTDCIEEIFGTLEKMGGKNDAGYSGIEILRSFLSEFCFRYTF